MGNEASRDGTVGKALDVLDQIAAFERPVRFSEILDRSPHPKATLHRLIQTLTNQGLLTYSEESGTYILGIRLVRLAHSAWRQSSLAPIARPFLDALAKDVGETLHLAQMDDGQVLYMDKRNAAEPVEMFSSAGKIGPGHSTGVGKAILAFMSPQNQSRALGRQSFYKYTSNTLTTEGALKTELTKIAKTGIAFDCEEHEIGIICIAVPILNNRKLAIGAISLTSTTARNSLKSLKNYSGILQKTANQITQAAKESQFPT